MTLVLLFLACNTPSAPETEPTAQEHEHGATQEHGSTHEHASPHEHEAAHGGEVKMMGQLHVELRFMPEGLMVWVTNAEEQPVDASTLSLEALVQDSAGVHKATFSPMGDHLHGAVKLEHGKAASAVLTLTQGGQASSARFEVAAVGLSVHDHTALHGGVVGMAGDVHVEYAPADGVHRFFLSNERREIISAQVSGTLTDGDKSLPLSFDAATGLLSAPAEGAGTRPVVLQAKVGEQEVSMPFKALLPLDAGAAGR